MFWFPRRKASSTTRREATSNRARRRWRPELELLEERDLLATFAVSVTTGSDTSGTGSAASPYRSIQRAVNQSAGTGDRILVAAGTYTYQASQDQIIGSFGTTGVVAVVQKNVTILGGFTSGNFTSPNPAANLTIIDGQGQFRGVLVTEPPGNAADTGLRMEGFTVRNGIARGIPARQGFDQFFAFGGGINVEFANVVLRDMAFENNQALGNDVTTSFGGAGAGGGLAIRTSVSLPASATLERVRFANNIARGGTGTDRGGFGQGGAIFADFANNTGASIIGSGITFTSNSALGGASTGSGVGSDTEKSDGQGGAIDIVHVRIARFANVTATGNQGFGGNVPNGSSGGGFGGAIQLEESILELFDSTLSGNEARGANGLNTNASVNSNLGLGGGINVTNATVTLDRVSLIGNIARGGDGQQHRGAAGGGGIAISTFTGPTTSTITNSVIADNLIQMGGGQDENLGGGGGGLWLQGSAANITHTTIANNRSANQSLTGQAIVMLNAGSPNAATANVSFSIIANHTSSANNPAVIWVFPSNTITLNRGLYAGNTKNDNSADNPAVCQCSGPGTYNGLTTMATAPSPGFISPGSPSEDYHLAAGSAAINQATGSTTAVDRDLESRLGVHDIGAYEFFGTRSTPGVFDPGSAAWFLRFANTGGSPNIGPFTYGDRNWVPVVGDWNADGITSIGVVDPRPGTIDPNSQTWYLRNSNSPGSPDAQFPYGAPGWIPLSGDWNGDNFESLGVVEPTANGLRWYLRNFNGPGAPDFTPFIFGLSSWIPMAGDWDGDGVSSIGAFDPSSATWYLSNSNMAGAQVNFGPIQFGAAGWKPIVGDWDGNGTTTLGVFDVTSGRWFLRNSNSAGSPDIIPFSYGLGVWKPVSGIWTRPAGLQAAGGAQEGSAPADALDQGQLNGIVAAALRRLENAAIDASVVNLLAGARFEIGQLDGPYLGLAYVDAGLIVIDEDAAGYGWFIDPTPLEDDDSLGTGDGRMDLLTVVMHELGHLAGQNDLNALWHPEELMTELLAAGTRRLDALDAVFGNHLLD